MASSDEDGAVNMVHHVVPPFLFEHSPQSLFLHPSSSDESISSSAELGVVTRTSSGTIIATPSAHSRRHSSKWLHFLFTQARFYA